MKKIQIQTNKGVTFDRWLNRYLNMILWFKGIEDDEERVIAVVSYHMQKIDYLLWGWRKL